MSDLTASYTYDGEPVVCETRRAYEVVAKELYATLTGLEDFVGIVADHQREAFEQARRQLLRVACEASRIAYAARVYEEAGVAADVALASAVSEGRS